MKVRDMLHELGIQYQVLHRHGGPPVRTLKAVGRGEHDAGPRTRASLAVALRSFAAHVLRSADELERGADRVP